MLSLQTIQISNLIGCIYDSATDPKRWPHFLEQLALATTSAEAIILMHDSKRAEHTVTSSWGSDPASLRSYQEHYAPMDLWTEKAYSMPTCKVATSEELWPLRHLLSSEYYSDFLRPINIKHAIFGLVANQSGLLANISLFRHPEAGKFLESESQLLKLLVPHVQKAFAIHFKFACLQSSTGNLERALDMLTFGVIFLDSAKSILFMNQRARRHVSSADGLNIRGGKILLGNPNETAQLQSLINGATKTGIGCGIGAGGTLLASRVSLPPLCLTIAPLRSETMFPQSAAVIFISDPHERAELPIDLLRRCYGLTAAEARLAQMLVEGHSLTDVAAQLAVSINTAKSQLKCVFSKTRVKRQAELVRILLRSSLTTITADLGRRVF